MNDENILFEMDNMKYAKYSEDGQRINSKIINISEGSNVILDGIIFGGNIVSKIEIFKYQSSLKENDSIFVNVFMGNIKLATKIFKTDVVLNINRNGNIQTLNIKEAREYDYKKDKSFL